MRLGRNEICYCGSGKKYKKCCMNKDGELANGLSFKVIDSSPNMELLEALEESEEIIRGIKTGKREGYNDMNDLIKA